MEKVLIANRGEIAVRVVRACRDAGLASVAVYAEQELDAPHVRLADEAFALGGTQPSDTYLAMAKLIDLARRSGADAVHPGYGFLAENGDFAEAVVGAGLTWIGPPAQAIRDLGDKTVARRLAAAVGAPLVPGLAEPARDVSEIRSFAADHGYPLLIKAAFGGGGRGMKVVRSPDQLDEAFESAVREAEAAFGRGECFVERYLEQARHVETQCLADGRGKVVVLSTRDCSLQRRNQKLVEEAPAPFLADEQVERIYAASKAILAEAGYVNAGTCEFLLAPDGTISFNEVNTRLQVEHPVTELVTGFDVVQEQFRIASGGLIGYDDPVVTGHAIEFRVNGEDPAAGFLPSPGRLRRWRVPSGPGVRWDGAYEEGDVLPAEFDSLLGKLVVYGRDRRQALAYARRALAEFEVAGIATVLPMDRLVVDHPDFVSEPFRVHTRWIETALSEALDALPPAPVSLESEQHVERQRLVLEVEGRRVEVTLPEGFGNLGGPTLPPPPPRRRREPVTAGAGTGNASDQSHAGQGGQGGGGQRDPCHTGRDGHRSRGHEDGAIPGRTDGRMGRRSGRQGRGRGPTRGGTVPSGRQGTARGRTVTSPGSRSTASRLADLDERRRLVYEAAESAAVERQSAHGKLTARQRIDALVDPGSFREFDALARHGSDQDPDAASGRPYGDGVVTGLATVNGRDICLFSQDFSVFGGSLGEIFGQKVVKVMDVALQIGCPIVGINDSGGARIQEGVASLGLYGEIFYRNTVASGFVPQISVIAGPCAGGAVYSPALTDFTVMVDQVAHMFITGPDVIKAVTGEDVGFEELGGAATHASRTGNAHYVAPDESDAFDFVRALLGYLPQSSQSALPRYAGTESAERTSDDLLLDRLIPDSDMSPYDMRTVIATVLDSGELLEVHEAFAPNIICGLGRVEGSSVAVVANQPMHLAGTLDIDAAEKAARFVRTCDAFGIPILTFVDVPGFLPGTDQEWQGIIRRGAKLIYAYAEATVPKVTVVTRKAYGGAYVVMGSKHLRSDVNLAWPTAEVAVMGADGAVNIVHHRELATSDDPALRERLVAEYRQMYDNPYAAAERGYVDAVIRPSETRVQVASSLRSLRHKRPDPAIVKKHGNIPL